jgi:L-alanine-DL-glutamate epimerase-like enolase superfamily enzyme
VSVSVLSVLRVQARPTRGFRSFKIKIGADEAADLDRVRAVARVARGATILLDANQAYDPPRMLRFLRTLRRHGIVPSLLEQPVPRGDWDGLAQLTRESGVPVCADESVKSLADAVRAVKHRAVNVINIKFMKSGILEGAEIARLARAAGMRLMIGAMMESGLAITAAAHFAAGLGGFDFVDLDTTFFVKGPLSRSRYLDQGGRFEFAGAGPGIGVSVP